jgi:hypothetical protein
MILVSNGTRYEQAVLRQTLDLKNVKGYCLGPSEHPLQLSTPELQLDGFLKVLLFVDEKWPLPNLFPGDVNARAHLRQIVCKTALAAAHNDTATLQELIAHTHDANPFLLGEQLSILDVLLTPITASIPNQHYTDHLTATLTQWTTSQSGEDWASPSF